MLTRLLSHARAVGVDPNTILARYGLERFLYRLGRSPHSDRFVLKGGMLLRVWLGETSRPTRDADLLGYGEVSAAGLRAVFQDVCRVTVEADAVSFASDSVRVAPVRVEDEYGGQRVKVQGLLGKARLAVQIDVGIGDAVTPTPEWIDYPSLLDVPRPRLRAYQPETVIAEKLHAMAVLGMANSRMRDFFDIFELARQLEFDGAVLASAVGETFTRRRTPLGSGLPVALTPAFAADREKQAQWRGFMRKSRLKNAPAELAVAVDAVAAFLEPILTALQAGHRFAGRWPRGGDWHE